VAIVDRLVPLIGGLIGGIVGDDKVGSSTLYLSPKQMVLLAARTANSVERRVGYKIATPLLSGDGGSYKIYFGTVPS
jgi:hypothetical protein